MQQRQFNEPKVHNFILQRAEEKIFSITDCIFKNFFKKHLTARIKVSILSLAQF